MENKIKLFLPNGEPVIRQMKLEHRDMKQPNFLPCMLYPHALKNKYQGPRLSFLGRNCNFAAVKGKMLSSESMCSAGHALHTVKTQEASPASQSKLRKLPRVNNAKDFSSGKRKMPAAGVSA